MVALGVQAHPLISEPILLHFCSKNSFRYDFPKVLPSLVTSYHFVSFICFVFHFLVLCINNVFLSENFFEKVVDCVREGVLTLSNEY